MKLAHRLILGALLPPSLIWGVGLHAKTVSRSALDQQLRISHADRCRVVLDQIDQKIQDRISEWIPFCNDPDILQFLARENRDFESDGKARARLAERDLLWRNRAKTREPQPFETQIANNRISVDLRRHIGEQARGHGRSVCGEVFLTNRQGGNVAMTGRTTDYDQSDEAWWTQAIEKGIHVSDLEFDLSAKVHSCDICLRIDDAKGNVAGVLKIVLDVHEVLQILDRQRERDGDAGFGWRLFARDGRIAYSSSKEPEHLQDGRSYLPKDGLLDLDTTVDRLDQNSGKRYLASYAQSHGAGSFPGLGWTLMLEQDAEQAFASLAGLDMQILLLAIVATIVTLILEFRLATSLPRRLGHLAEAAEEIGNDNLNFEIDEDGKDELGDVGRCLRTMSWKLREKTRQLEVQAKKLSFKNELLGEELDIRKRIENDRLVMEQELRAAQKLESIGQLAAGIAHEINTPIQYVSDNMRFLKDSFVEILDFARKVEEGPEDLEKLVEDTDLEFFAEEIPMAIEQSLEGVDRVRKIVRAMKEFSHPETEERSTIDLPSNIETTLTICRNEWKYVAETDLELDPDLPPLPCYPGPFNQILLNLIVNAAHAIKDRIGDGGLGRITIGAKQVDDNIRIWIRDSGTGIPEHIQSKIFDPFFTTKEVGKGTGQGLSLVHTIVTQKHQGRIWFETEQGVGTTFLMDFPLSTSKDPEPAAAGSEQLS